MNNSSAFAVFILVMASSCLSNAFQLQTKTIISSSNLAISYVESVASPEKSNNSVSDAAPTTLFLHGLESSSQTWKGIQTSLHSPSIAMDCRGCGHSELGDPASFTPEALVEDVKSLVESHKLLKERPFVFVGHSVGGKIAMEYTAKYPEDVTTLVVIDMDIRTRGMSNNKIETFDFDKAVDFRREHDSLESLKNALGEVGYPVKDRLLRKWIAEGKVEEVFASAPEDTKSFWSNVNPGFRALIFKAFSESDSTIKAWAAIAKNWRDCDDVKVYLMLAGVGSVCEEDSIKQMQDIMQTRSGGKSLMLTKTYSRASHTVHNSKRDEFMRDLDMIIEAARLRSTFARSEKERSYV